MNLAINYSRPAAQLVQDGKIKIDRFKTPDWDWIIEEAGKIKPVAVHFTLEAGNDSLTHIDWDRIRRVQDLTATPFVNLHLDARGSYHPGIPTEATDPYDVAGVITVIQNDLAIAVKKLGAERIIIENSPYRGEDGNTLRICIEPELITQLLQETGCGFLLDISHAIITAKTIGMDPGDYLSMLPMDRLKELHFAGIQRSAATGRLVDHLSIQEEDWHWLDWVLTRIKNGEWSTPWMLAFEYGGVGEPFVWRSDPQVIAEQVPRLYDRISSIET